MKRIRNYSISGSKYFILGVIFLVTVIITFISMKFEQIMPSATTMADATLPTVAMDTEAGTQYNALHGYTSELDSTLFYGNITPVAKDRKLTVTINTYGEDIEGVAYKIRSLEDKSLIENTEVSDYDNAGSSINVTFNIRIFLIPGKSMRLRLCLRQRSMRQYIITQELFMEWIMTFRKSLILSWISMHVHLMAADLRT